MYDLNKVFTLHASALSLAPLRIGGSSLTHVPAPRLRRPAQNDDFKEREQMRTIILQSTEREWYLYHS
jgi:hypothetical protein